MKRGLTFVAVELLFLAYAASACSAGGGDGAGGSGGGAGTAVAGSAGAGAGTAGSSAGSGTAGTTTGAGTGGMTSAGAGGTTTSGGGGSGGTPAGAGGGTGGSTGPCGAPGLIFCDDFEKATGVDLDPTKYKALPPDLSMNMDRPQIVSDQFHSGGKSVTVGGNILRPEFWITPTIDLAPTNNNFFVRVFMRMTVASSGWNSHGWYLVASDNPNPFNNGMAEIRLGASAPSGGTHMLDVNLYNKVGGGEASAFSDGGFNKAKAGGVGVNMTADAWHCVEAHFNGAGQELRVWIDGAELMGLHVSADTITSDDGVTRLGTWAPTFRHVRVGFQGNGANAGKLWYDDFAIGTQRIGCGG